ncbi:aldo/keto reductase [Hyunsoonleella pacifica]|uniref:Aldo/keto reductase n=1 Tax=Hyunsoonleella pacifica TaxID=1080224 RepID=A0A4Q9FNR5_9FLAO|nr:aldo/keto reductase [Hyunsoonleella pacifica]TBN15614.1 aldo/keto reductase [Hyunsoonleella pacifica]GGD21282.1 oxidoreductase [Hyunsoonleella pacifica]
MSETNTKIGLGLAALGRPEYINIRNNNAIDKSKNAFKQNTFSVLDEAYKLGVRYFDTAPSYGKGEAFLQEWQDSKLHDDTILGTKWGYTYVANWELGYAGKHEIKEHSIEKLIEQWQISKALLPNLKYYQVHSATFESGILENEEVLNQLRQIKKETGLKIGITTSGANQKDVIASALNINIKGDALFDSFQVTYNMFEQDTFEVLKTALKNGKHVIIKEALANGRIFPNKNFKHYSKTYQVLENLAKKYQVGTDAIALRFVMDNLKPTYVLSGASDINQLKSNMKAFKFKLSEEEINVLKTICILPQTYWEERSKLRWN